MYTDVAVAAAAIRKIVWAWHISVSNILIIAEYTNGCIARPTYSRHNRRNQTSPTTENRKEPNDKLGNAQQKRNSKTPHHPPRNFLVRVESLLHVVARNLLCRRVLELPHGEGVEPEVGFGFGAPGNCLDARLVVFVALAVRPETDLVEVLEVLGRGGALERVEEVVVDLDVIGEVVFDVFGVFFEFTCVCLWGMLGLRFRYDR
jgi:hypothetical protein